MLNIGGNLKKYVFLIKIDQIISAFDFYGIYLFGHLKRKTYTNSI